MNRAEVEDILQAYGGLDGAFVIKGGFEIGVDEQCVWVLVKAYRNPETQTLSGWKNLKITARDRVTFSWKEHPQDTNVVLNWPVLVFEWEGRIVIDFDPLHSSPENGGHRLSRFYLGGKFLRIEELD